MSRYLLTLKARTLPETMRDLPPPVDYLVEPIVEAAVDAADGLERWDLDLQLAGSIVDWAKAPAYDALWTYLKKTLAHADVRPRFELRIRSRFDKHSVTVQLAYAGDHELQRVAENVRQKLEAAAEAKTKMIRTDVGVAF